MIDRAFEFIKGELNTYLKTEIPMGESDRVEISNIVQQEEDVEGGVSDMKDNRVLFSLIHLEEERIFKEQRRSVLVNSGTVRYREPDIRINLYVIFSSHFRNYPTGLKHLSGVLSYFQAHNVFDATDYPTLDPRFERIVMDLYSFSLDQNFQFWQSLGGKFLPSVLYKMRLLTYQEEEIQSIGKPIFETISELHDITTS